MHNQNAQALLKIKFTQRFSRLKFLKIFILPPSAPKSYLVLNVENNTKEGNGEKNNTTW